ncbi:MAG: hypothetical protein ACPGYT_10325 [Nitrospirales bacterium]
MITTKLLRFPQLLAPVFFAFLIFQTFLLTGCLQSNMSTEELLVELKSQNAEIRNGAAWILDSRGPEAVSTLISALHNEKDAGAKYGILYS